MKKQLVWGVRWFGLILLMMGLSIPALAAEKAKAKAKMEPVTVSGMVTEQAKDKKGNVTAVALNTADGVEYKVDKNGKGAELLKLVGKNVKATGTVQEAKGKKTITIAAYEEMAGATTEQKPAEQPAVQKPVEQQPAGQAAPGKKPAGQK